MTENIHRFRYLFEPGTRFPFMKHARLVFAISLLVMLASIGALFVNKAVRGQYMNWTIDFSGGTEIVYSFRDKANPATFKKVSAADVRGALDAAGEKGADVSEMSWKGAAGQVVAGHLVRTPRFASIRPEQGSAVVASLTAALVDKGVEKIAWAGDRLTVRATQAIDVAQVASAMAAAGLELKPWSDDERKQYSMPDEGTGLYKMVFASWGTDRQIEQQLEAKLAGVDVVTEQSYAVGAKAGAQLRDDAAKSLVFAILLIMLYLAFRFDIRYAPGAAFATIHDAVIVVGVFAVTWTEVSLTSVAALLTVIGFSVNDTVVIFDRIRENQTLLRGKALDRIIDQSVNETLVRSILTSLTVFSTTLVMNIFGEGLVRNFAFAMNVGVVVGAYSSIFLASPIFLWISQRWYSGKAQARVTSSATA